MRETKTSKGLTVRAVAGSYVVLLGFSMKKADCTGLMGFAIHRTDHEEEDAYWMEGMKTFEATDPGFEPGSKYPTNRHPIQGFTWSDFTAKPGHKYTYRVQALRGSPEQLDAYKETSVTVTTESEEGGNHDVFFNRGVAASQEYSRRFGKREPDDGNPDDPRWEWLSRGAMEAITNFIGRATGASWGLRVAAYEFRLDLVAEALREAKKRKAEVRVLYDACDNPPKEGVVFPRDKNRELVEAERIKGLCKERVTRDDVKQPPIAHNKFIVLLKNKRPVAVLTGSTNFSRGGVFGQSNVVHIVEDEKIAANFLEYWSLLEGNPDHATLRESVSELNSIPKTLPPKGTTTIFSPQQDLTALEWYAKMAEQAEGALMMTFAFGINKVFKNAYLKGKARLRYASLEKLLPPGTKKAQRPAAEAEMLALRKMKENRFAVGSKISTNGLDRWVKESLTGLNSNVNYVHTKFMLIDPLGDDPIVIAGSANFSDASTTQNDENMLVIRGNKRVADIYVGEYLRIWNHHAFREWASRKQEAGDDPANSKFKFLDDTSKWWRSYFGDSDRSRQRQYFAGVSE